MFILIDDCVFLLYDLVYYLVNTFIDNLLLLNRKKEKKYRILR